MIRALRRGGIARSNAIDRAAGIVGAAARVRAGSMATSPAIATPSRKSQRSASARLWRRRRSPWLRSAGVPIAVGIAAGIVADVDALGAMLAGAALIALFAAVNQPGLLLASLLYLIVLQDMIVDAGMGAARYGDEALLLAGLAGVAAVALRGRLWGAYTALDLPLLALVGVMLASAISAGVPFLIAALGMLALLKGPLAFALAARIPLRIGAVRRAAGGLAMPAAIAALVGVAQRVGGEPIFEITGRADYFEIWRGVKAPGLFSHHNALGHVTVLGGALALSLAMAADAAGRRTEMRTLRLAALCCLAGLIASASRESWIAAAAAAVFVALSTRSGRALFAALMLGSTLAILGGLSYAVSPLLRDEMARRLAGVSAGWHDFGLGFSGWAFRGEYRVYAALKSAEITADHPFLGVGPGRFGGAVAQRFGSPVHEAYRVLPLDGIHEPIDLFWARLPAEIGLLGAAAYLLVFGSAIWVLVRAARGPGVHIDTGESSTFVRALALGGVGAAVAAVVFAAFSPALEDPLVAIPVFVWAGVVWRLGRADGQDGGWDHGRDDGRDEGQDGGRDEGQDGGRDGGGVDERYDGEDGRRDDEGDHWK